MLVLHLLQRRRPCISSTTKSGRIIQVQVQRNHKFYSPWFYHLIVITTCFTIVSSFSLTGLFDTNNHIGSSSSSTSISMMTGGSSSSSNSIMTKLLVVSYNVLSSHLSDPTYYSTINPEYLNPSNRLKVVLEKLEVEVQKSSSSSTNDPTKPPTIFALQEVSYDWASEFHTFFANHGYHLITGLYGAKYNGYMGVALAWPVSNFKCLGTKIARLSDHRIGGWPKNTNPPSTWEWLIKKPLQQLGLVEVEKECIWKHAQRRNNVIIGTILQDITTGTKFCIANYHMPCLFYVPPTMTLHAEMAIRYVQDMAKISINNPNDAEGEETTTTIATIPYILAGDFNLKPVDGIYKYLTTGVLDKEDPFYPQPPKYDPSFVWTPSIVEPVASAYQRKLGHEPDFTNNARVGEKEPFVDTLDYIFISSNDSIQVTDVLELQHRDNANGPFPNLAVKEPSDHVLIAANFEISNAKS